MVAVKLFVKDGRTAGFEVSGHADSASPGRDIVCAAVSSAAYMAANTVTEVMGIDAVAEARDGYMKLLLQPDIGSEDFARASEILDGFALHVRSLAKQYPRNIKVIYGGNKRCLG